MSPFRSCTGVYAQFCTVPTVNPVCTHFSVYPLYVVQLCLGAMAPCALRIPPIYNHREYHHNVHNVRGEVRL